MGQAPEYVAAGLHVSFDSLLDSPWHFVPHYTLSPEAAMDVLEKCGADRHIIIERTKESQWTIAELDETFERLHSTTADTLPLAICLFALEVFK